MPGAAADAFLAVMYRIEYFTLSRVWDGLTDDELFWEPAPGAWNVRPRDECDTAHPYGAGDWLADTQLPEPDPVPMATIAWLLWHMASMPERLTETELFGGEHTMASGWTSPYLAHHPIFTTADDAMAALRRGWAALRAAIEATSDAEFARTAARYTYSGERRPGLLVAGPPGPVHPLSFFVAGTLVEVDHHGTQICTLRDLYAHRAG